MSMEITVRVEVQYLAPDNAVMHDVLQMFRRPMWVRFMMRYISPRLKNASPADKSVLQSVSTDWAIASPRDDSSECVICLTDSPQCEHARLPCGHEFHAHCVHSWLQMRSTCPVCRFQFRKAFAGTYAVHSLQSTVLLQDAHRAMSAQDIMRISVAKQIVRAVVNVTLVKVMSEEKQQEYPCELSALLMHVDGETFSEYDVLPPASLVACAPRIGAPKTDSTAVGAARDRQAGSGDSSGSVRRRLDVEDSVGDEVASPQVKRMRRV